ncbi:hypothetical protein GJ496_000057 [Pomphorhynchus laevis]|nr:hypothetical protein GJ496_000057 [Pomphorhynchus laevis]
MSCNDTTKFCLINFWTSTIKAFKGVQKYNTKDVVDVSKQLLKNIEEQFGSYGGELSDDISMKIHILIQASKENPANYSTIQKLLYYERCLNNKQNFSISASYICIVWIMRTYQSAGI